METTAEPPSLLARLRSETQTNHQRAESLLGLPHSLAAHIRTLKIFLGFLEPWEVEISKMLAPLQSQLQGRRKVTLLLTDLQNLGVSAPDLSTIPRCEKLPTPENIPAALGSMYVFEGATLGGQILSHHVESKLGLHNGIGYSFYQSYGLRVGIMWREYGQLLIKNTPVTEFDTVIQSARDTFDSLCRFVESLNQA